MVASTVDLYEAHTAFYEPAGEQTFLTEIIRALFANAIKRLHVFLLLIEIHRLRCTHLHLIGELVAGDASG